MSPGAVGFRHKFINSTEEFVDCSIHLTLLLFAKSIQYGCFLFVRNLIPNDDNLFEALAKEEVVFRAQWASGTSSSTAWWGAICCVLPHSVTLATSPSLTSSGTPSLLRHAL